MKTKLLLKYILISFIAYIAMANYGLVAKAETLSDPNYNLEIQLYSPSPTQKVISQPEDIKKINTETEDKSDIISFYVSSLLLDFGLISPTNPVIRDIIIKATGSNKGFSINVFENKQLTSATANSTDVIPDTTCDNGNCSESNTETWQSILSYGLGYRCDNKKGKSCVEDFNNPLFFKHFPNQAASQIPQPVISYSGKESIEAKITHRINASPSQKIDYYQNSVTYILSPNF